jgi:hypothetical protein
MRVRLSIGKSPQFLIGYNVIKVIRVVYEGGHGEKIAFEA